MQSRRRELDALSQRSQRRTCCISAFPRAVTALFRASFIWRDAEIEERGGPIVVCLSGERYDPDRHRLLTEIKEVQMHQLVVENKEASGAAGSFSTSDQKTSASMRSLKLTV